MDDHDREEMGRFADAGISAQECLRGLEALRLAFGEADESFRQFLRMLQRLSLRCSFASFVYCHLQHSGVTEAQLAERLGWSARKLRAVLRYPKRQRISVLDAMIRMRICSPEEVFSHQAYRWLDLNFIV